jgi:hypothetical protein
MKQNLTWSNDYWFPETKANPMMRKIKIAKMLGMNLDNIKHTHYHYINNPNTKVYKIPVGDKKDSSYKQFIKHYLGSWVK